MYFRQEKYVNAAEYHQKALDVQIKSHNPNLNLFASYSNNIGVVQLKQGKYVESAKSSDRVLKILQKINEPVFSEIVNCTSWANTDVVQWDSRCSVVRLNSSITGEMSLTIHASNSALKRPIILP